MSPPAAEGARAAWADVGLGTPFAGAIEFLRRKINLPTERWDDIARSAHDRAFIVAGAAKADLLAELRQAVIDAGSGGGLAGFRRDFRSIVARNGWTGWTGEGSAAGVAWRTAIIYRTNMATAYAAGRWRQLNDPEFARQMPYWRYRHADGVAHPRPQHVAWNGLTLPRDHPFWRTNFPPNGWGCHCKVFAERAPAEGAATEPPPGWDERDAASGELPGVDEGFDYAPGANVDTALRQMVQDKLITYPPAIAKAMSAELNRMVYATADVAGWSREALADASIVEPLLLGFVEDAPRVSGIAGHDVRGYIITLPGSVPRHVRNAHEFDGKGQRMAQPADYEHVAQVLNAADVVRAGAPSQHDNATVVALKRIAGETFRAVFEVLAGKRNRALALRSLVIKT